MNSSVAGAWPAPPRLRLRRACERRACRVPDATAGKHASAHPAICPILSPFASLNSASASKTLVQAQNAIASRLGIRHASNDTVRRYQVCTQRGEQARPEKAKTLGNRFTQNREIKCGRHSANQSQNTQAIVVHTPGSVEIRKLRS